MERLNTLSMFVSNAAGGTALVGSCGIIILAFSVFLSTIFPYRALEDTPFLAYMTFYREGEPDQDTVTTRFYEKGSWETEHPPFDMLGYVFMWVFCFPAFIMCTVCAVGAVLSSSRGLWYFSAFIERMEGRDVESYSPERGAIPFVCQRFIGILCPAVLSVLITVSIVFISTAETPTWEIGTIIPRENLRPSYPKICTFKHNEGMGYLEKTTTSCEKSVSAEFIDGIDERRLALNVNNSWTYGYLVEYEDNMPASFPISRAYPFWMYGAAPVIGIMIATFFLGLAEDCIDARTAPGGDGDHDDDRDVELVRVTSSSANRDDTLASSSSAIKEPVYSEVTHPSADNHADSSTEACPI
jgi:hypothetical protein